MKIPIILQPSRPLQRRRLVNAAAGLLPELEGRPIRIRFQAALVAARQPVHASTHIPNRVVILDRDLIAQPAELARILIHEVFHFAWVRLGNPRRNSYADLVEIEFKRGARGELGWSAEHRKLALAQPCGVKWREYVCESFCDTAAWRYANIPQHDEFTLSTRNRKARERWFATSFANSPIKI